MAGGVWNLEAFEHWLDNPEIGPIVFNLARAQLLHRNIQFLCLETQINEFEKGDVYLNRFSPTGFLLFRG